MTQVRNEEVSKDLKDTLEGAPPEIGGVEGLEFIKVTEYTTFSAEYAEDGNDLIFHFFLPEELKGIAHEKAVKDYWETVFPTVLEPVATEVFRAGPPRLQATFITDYDLNSWWFRAKGFVESLDPDALCKKFLEKMDQGLDATKTT